MQHRSVAFVLLSAVFSLNYGDKISHIELQLDEESGPYKTFCDEYGYFKVTANDPCDDLNVEVIQIEGEPNLYISKDPHKYPSLKSLSWASYEWGTENFTISSWDINFSPGNFYIGVHAYCGEDVSTKFQAAKYKVKVRQVMHNHPRTVDIFGKTEVGVVNAKEYSYHRFCLPSDCYNVEIKLDNCIDASICPFTYAWPELVISQNEEHPTEKSMAWILGETGKRSIILNQKDLSVKAGHYYIAVYGWCTPDDICVDRALCGPCEYADSVGYNISVIPTDLCTSGTSEIWNISIALIVTISIFEYIAFYV